MQSGSPVQDDRNRNRGRITTLGVDQKAAPVATWNIVRAKHMPALADRRLEERSRNAKW